MQYSPKLKKAMAEINAILKSYDINAFVYLHEPGFLEYVHRVDASYSAATLHQGELRVRTKGMQKTPAEKRRLLQNTSNFFKLLTDVMARDVINYMAASKMIDSQVGAEHGRGRHTSRDEVDN